MSTLGILDLVIGLFFIYFVFSVICTSIVEGLSQMLMWRSKMLETWLINLLDQTPADSKKQEKNGTNPPSSHSEPSNPLSGHQLVLGLTNGVRKPDYIPANIFSAALFEVLNSQHLKSDSANDIHQVYDAQALQRAIENSTILKPDLKNYLLQAFKDGAGSMTLVKSRLEKWFDQSMERLIESYKKRTRVWTFWIALLVAGFSNVDTLAIMKYLRENPEKAAILVEEAKNAGRDSVLLKEVQQSFIKIEHNLKNDTTQRIDSITIRETKLSLQKLQHLYEDQQNLFQSVGLPIGWANWSIPSEECYALVIGSKILGLLLTTLALTLGAPFWYDMINKLVNIRSAGKKPASTTDDTNPNTPVG